MASFVSGAALALFVSLVAAGSAAAACPNAEFRTGYSAQLPDCRAYELVTPPDIGAHFPSADVFGSGYGIPTTLATGDGDSVVFPIVGGALPGLAGSGVNDLYRADRGSGEWTTSLFGPRVDQSESSGPKGLTPDLGYSLFAVGSGTDNGSLVFEGGGNYLRKPDGSYELVAIGSLGRSPDARVKFLSPDGSHILFTTSTPLEPGALNIGTIYDRSVNGPTHVVSIYPDGTNVTYRTRWEGTSADGSVTLFKRFHISYSLSPLYARIDNQKTVEVAPAGAGFAGITPDGDTIYYVQGGNLFAYDVGAGTADQLTTPGNIKMVSLTDDGSKAYFTSTTQINGEGTEGQPNLYLWNAAGNATTFVATLAPSDLTRKPGLGRWQTESISPDVGQFTGPGNNASRTTPDGRYFVFESAAKLTEADNAGHVAIYRYDSVGGSLLCVSCRPDGAPSTGDARLQSVSENMRAMILIDSLTADGGRVFFETSEALVPRDSGGTNDIYEWSLDPGSRPTVSLISSGVSRKPTPGLFGEVLFEPNMLWAVTPDGGDVFFVTHDSLVPSAGSSGSREIYAARVDGGLASQQIPPNAPCLGDGCQGAAVPPPAAPAPGTDSFGGHGNVKPTGSSSRRHCRGKAKRRKKRAHHARKKRGPARSARSAQRNGKRKQAKHRACKRRGATKGRAGK